MPKGDTQKRQKLANPYYGLDYVERLEQIQSVDLRDNFLRIQANCYYSKLIHIDGDKKIKKEPNIFSPQDCTDVPFT